MDNQDTGSGAGFARILMWGGCRTSNNKRTQGAKSGKDFFIAITESRLQEDGKYQKHKIFLYKEDFAKFEDALAEAIEAVQKLIADNVGPDR